MTKLDDNRPASGSLKKRLRPSIQKRIEAMWEREPEARRFSDPEGVHQMRVATRKLRAALDAGSGVFPGKRYRRVRKKVRSLTRALGAVRDPDVMLGTLYDMQREAGERPRPGVQRLINRLEGERDAARKRLIAVLDDLEEADFRKTSLKTFRRSGKKRRLRRRDAASLIADHVRRFNDLTSTFPDEDDAEGLHEVRIATKQLRYALQLAKKPLRPESSALIDELTRLQDEMGEIHNLDVLTGLVREELHSLADEEIDLVLSGRSTEDADDGAATRADLISLLAVTASDRHQRYAGLRGRHDLLQAEGLASRLGDLAKPAP